MKIFPFKSFSLVLFFFSFILIYNSCIQSTTPDMDFYCTIHFPADSFKYDVDVVAGNFEIINIGEENIFHIKYFQVRGGHSQIGNFKFNIQDGITAKRLEIFQNEKLFKSYSYNEIINFPKKTIDSLIIYDIKI
jgi:hypothetical protein